MNKSLQHKRLKRYYIPGHAHELTFSCYKRRKYFTDERVCSIFLEELEKARSTFNFKVWAYVIMPNHIHLLIWPPELQYSIAKILNTLDGKTAKHYRDYLINSDIKKYEKYLILSRGRQVFRFWLPGGGYDRNIVNSKAIYNSIKYIENNPVRTGMVMTPEEWPWSSAYARIQKKHVIPDEFNTPIML